MKLLFEIIIVKILGIVMTNNAVRLLHEHLKAEFNIQYLLTNRLN